MQSGKNISDFTSLEQAKEFCQTFLKDYPEEMAQGRSAKGWHYDYHEINGVMREHINVYNKHPKFSIHIFWDGEG